MAKLVDRRSGSVIYRFVASIQGSLRALSMNVDDLRMRASYMAESCLDGVVPMRTVTILVPYLYELVIRACLGSGVTYTSAGW